MTKIEITTHLLGVQDELKRFAYKLTANREDANDLLQETTLKVLKNQDKFEENTNFKAWIYTIMRNLFINDYRKLVRTQTFIDQTENLYHLNIPQESGFESPSESLSIKEIKKSIDLLDEEYGSLFNMHVEGYKYEEIAEKKTFRWEQ
jgi:RNA polymerase sigma-70 factor (ECF subfamily)